MRRASSSVIVALSASLGVIALGLAAGSQMRGWAGGAAPTIALAASPVIAAVTATGFLAVLAGGAGVAGRAGRRHAGWVMAGVGLMAWASRSGDAVQFERLGGSHLGAAGEGLAWCAAIWLWAMCVQKLERASTGGADRRLRSVANHAAAAVVTAAVTLVCVWLVARTDLKGQVLAATAVGGLFGVAAGVAAGGPPRLGMAWVVAAGALASAWTVFGSGGEVAAWLIPLLRPMPGDYAAGALLGGSVGLLWTETLIVSGSHRSKATGFAPATPLRDRDAG